MYLTFFLGFIISFPLVQQSQAQPTTCISCTNCQDIYDGTDINSTCSKVLPNADSCQKTRIQLPGATLVSKSCAKSCQEQSIAAGTLRIDVTCCTTNNCNQAIINTLQPSVLCISFTILMVPIVVTSQFDVMTLGLFFFLYFE